LKKKIVSLTLSEEVYNSLKLFRNRSKLVDDVFSYLLLKIPQEEIMDIVKRINLGENPISVLFDNREIKVDKKPEKIKPKKTKKVKSKKEWW